MTTDVAPSIKLNEPVLRWSARAHSIAEVESELARIWAKQDRAERADGDTDGVNDLVRHVAARTSVMNLVVIARQPEVGMRTAATIQALTGRHPSRTLVVQSADPDGPSWVDARVEAHCVVARDDASETCAETIHLTAGGEAGQHLMPLVTPLLIHDLPVTVWWPGEPHFEGRSARELLPMADRVLVDGSGWSGDGLKGLAAMAELPARFDLEIADFALLRQARWREAIASTFDRPGLLPFLGHLDRIEVHYAASDGQPGMANVVRPMYHVAWLASRLGMTVLTPMRPGTEAWSGYDGLLRHGRRRVPIALRPIESTAPRGTTLIVQLHATRAGAQLWVEVTAYAEGVVVQASLDGDPMPERRFLAPRKREADLLAETIEAAGRDPIGGQALAMAARLVG